MRFSPFGIEHASGASPRERLGLLRKALDRANVDYSPANPQAALAILPSSAAPQGVRPARPQPFESPLPRAAKIAFLTSLFYPGAAGKVFPSPGTFDQDVLVLSLNAALELTLGSAGSAAALVVVTSIADAPLADHHRDLLWRSLGLPIFEQLTGWDGTVVARECEVHDGLHVAGDAAIAHIEDGEFLLTQLTVDESVLRARTGWTARINTSLCECGRETPRLKNLAPLAARVRAHAV